MSLPTFLTVSGSLRAGSFNTAILEHFAQFASAKANVVRTDAVGQLPLYNQDLDTDTPPAVVAAARAEIAASDCVVVATPEYNYGIPGPLKNWFDWMSRPYGAQEGFHYWLSAIATRRKECCGVPPPWLHCYSSCGGW